MNEYTASQQIRRVCAKDEFLASWRSAQDAEGSKSGDLDAYPYPGLRSFRPTEADLFFGRDSQIKDLRNLLADHNIIVVLGGSGSGKSSLVRAGLVPKLNSTSPIPERVGAWYVVEFRPKLDPINELFDAIFAQLISPVLTIPSFSDEATTSEEVWIAESARERARRIGALKAVFNIECELDASDEIVGQECRRRLHEILFEGTVVDVGGLFDFVEERLRVLDEVLSGGATSGAPNLLLLIDQFEEVFKPKVDPAGRDMIMSLITSIHTYKPFNLFLIITMRSEELHRCSEFLGVTEVINSSLYLVDLIGGRDIEQAIVGPARRILKSWDLDPGDPETGPYTHAALSRLHQIFDDGREVLPHPADQLPLMQHLLPLVWDKAIERWQDATDESPLQIDLEDIQALPGWSSPDGPLIGTLNERADRVLRRAIISGATKGGIKEDVVRQLLRVGFCCLAQLDDRGNVVRDFATLDEMLHASGAYERQPRRQDGCRSALQSAFGVFRQATLVNTGRNYDVNHEALIRGWKKYANWLKDARRHMDRLVSVDRMLGEDRTPEQRVGFLGRLSKKAVDYIFVENLARADQIAGDETSADLQDVLGPNAAFSEQWAHRTLEQADSASGNVEAKRHRVPERLGTIKQTIVNATKYREGARYRPRMILISLVGATAVAGIAASYVGWISSGQQELNNQFRFFRLQTEATSTEVDKGRVAAEDREAHAALTLAKEIASNLDRKSTLNESTAVFRTSLRQLDRGTRNLLSDVSVRILPDEDKDTRLDALQTYPAQCAVADPDFKTIDLIAEEPGSLGIQLRSEGMSGVKIVTMNPILHTADRQIAPVNSSNFGGQGLSPGALVCLSRDANWFLMWRPFPEKPGKEPPYIQRIVWTTTGPVSGEEKKWRAELSQHRSPTTSQTWDNVEKLRDEYPILNRAVRDGSQLIRSFESENRVGFLVELANGKTAVFWTNTGLWDPIPVNFELSHKLVNCKYSEKPKPGRMGEQQVTMQCGMGPIEFDGLNHALRAEYKGCNSEDSSCTITLALDYDPPDGQPGSPRVEFQHTWARIEAAAIWDDSLWVRDGNGQFWRYVVGLDALKKLMEERWKGLPKSVLMKAEYSESCKLVKCDTMLVPPWSEWKREELLR